MTMATTTTTTTTLLMMINSLWFGGRNVARDVEGICPKGDVGAQGGGGALRIQIRPLRGLTIKHHHTKNMTPLGGKKCGM